MGASTSSVKYPRDKVILHQIGRGPYAPSLTPFAVKLETYLRMAKIPYENAHDNQKSSKGKFPWIEYNDEKVADSSFCVRFLNKTFNVDLNAEFTPEERAKAHAFQKMLEENTYWTIALDRWVYNDDVGLEVLSHFGAPRLSLILYIGRRSINNNAYAHGMGRHTQEEVYEIMKEDLGALSAFLESKPFLLGDNPCEEDCAIFGMLSQFYWHSFGSRAGSIMKEFPNLCSYCERMKSTFWRDWNDCVKMPGQQGT